MRISVVCAPQTFGCNAGMYSVDLAAWHFLRKYFPDAEVAYSTLYPHKCDFGPSPFRYAPECGDMQVLRDSDVILYWGDFLHALHYRNEVASQLSVQGICHSPEQALDKVRRYLFLAESGSELLGKAVLYGGTLLFNPADSYDDELYRDDLKRLLGGARRVWVREPFSAFTVGQLQEQTQQQRCSHGTDCAQLLGRDFVDDCPSGTGRMRIARQERLGVFVGRSHLDADSVTAFISAIRAQLHLDLSWLDWGCPPFFLDRKNEILGRLRQADDDTDRNRVSTPLESLMALQGLDLLISDTYHACVNAWNVGIPAICLIDNSDRALAVNRGPSAGSRDKRVVFYWTYNAAPFLVYSSELSCESALQNKSMEIISLLNDRAIIKRISMQMSQHIRTSEDALARTLRA